MEYAGRPSRNRIGFLSRLIGVVASIALALALPTTAFAQRYYSIAWNSDGATNLTGAFGTWSNLTMSLGSYASGQHINSEMWFPTTPGGFAQYLEIGLRNGYDPTDPCNCVAYEAFWAEWDTSGNELRHTIQNTTPDGTSHNYEFQRNSHQNWWNVYRDYNFVATGTTQSSWTGHDHEAGGEIALSGTLDPTTVTGGFDMYLQDKNAAGSWYYWPKQLSSIDARCGPNPPGYCLNGFPYYTYEWSWNKG